MLVEGFWVRGQFEGFGDVRFGGVRDELSGSDAPENRSPCASRRNVAFDGDARESHPAGKQRHGESVVREGVQSEVDVAEEIEVDGECATRMFRQAVRQDTALLHPPLEGAARLGEINKARLRQLRQNAGPNIEHRISRFQEVVGRSKGKR